MKSLSKFIFLSIAIAAFVVASCTCSMADEKFSRVVIFDVSEFISNNEAISLSNKQDVIGFIVKTKTGMFSDPIKNTYMFSTLSEQLDCKDTRIDIVPDTKYRVDRVVVYCK